MDSVIPSLVLPLANEIGATDAISALAATDPVLHLPRDEDHSAAAQTARTRVRELVEKTLSARPQIDAQLLERAYAFAAEKHEGVARMTGEPYIEHPVAVAGILAELGMDDVSIAAGFLHDVPEDCGVSFEEMTERFGADVAHLVEGVTKLKKINFDTKTEKQGENLRKLFLAMAGDVRVIIIKLADRLHNMRTLDPFSDEKKRDVSAETLTFFAPIAHRLGIWRIKWELEDRSFKYLEPQVYRQIYSMVQRTRAQRATQVQEATGELQERLQAEGIEAEVNGRPKHFYSIRQKMIKQGLKFDAIHDLIALRVICNTKGDCYHALGIVHALWQQVPEMFFDYIATSKPNNYQSLHTKVLDGSGELLEIQIRTKEMHREAEFGIAAHWRYKAEGKIELSSEKAFGDRLRWLRPVVEMGLETEGDSASFLSNLRLDVGSEQVFVITPHGDAIYLPQGSTPVDFAYRVHSEIGSKCTGAKVNGRLVPLNYKLHNGDICEIQTSRSSKGPKRGWLDFVVTSHAKNRIKAFLRRENFEDNYRYGLERLEKAARSERLKIAGLVGGEALEKLALELGQKGTSELIAAIGYGEFSALNILGRLRAELAPQPKTAESSDGLSGAASNLLNRRPKTAEKDENGQGELEFAAPGEIYLDPDKAGDLLYSLGRCCAPIPGDEVRGYVTRGRGITVHRADCANLKHYENREPDRLLRAQWSSETEKPYQALVALEAIERTGLLADVTAIIAARKININSVNTYPLKHHRARLNLAVTITGAGQLDELINILRAVEGVTDVHRV